MASETRHVAICDRCGEEENCENDDSLPFSWMAVEALLEDGKSHWDLCNECKLSLLQWKRDKYSTVE